MFISCQAMRFGIAHLVVAWGVVWASVAWTGRAGAQNVASESISGYAGVEAGVATGAEVEVKGEVGLTVELYDVRDLIASRRVEGEMEVGAAATQPMSEEGEVGVAVGVVGEARDRGGERVEVERLAGLIRGIVGTAEHWEAGRDGEQGRGAIDELHGYLVVKTTLANHAEVASLIRQLHERAGRQLAVEARVLRVRAGLVDRLNAEVAGRDLVLDAEGVDFLERLLHGGEASGIEVLATARTVVADGGRVVLRQARQTLPRMREQPLESDGSESGLDEDIDDDEEAISAEGSDAAEDDDETPAPLDDDVEFLSQALGGASRPTRRAIKGNDGGGDGVLAMPAERGGEDDAVILSVDEADSEPADVAAEGGAASLDDADPDADRGGVEIAARTSDAGDVVVLDVRADLSLHEPVQALSATSSSPATMTRSTWATTARVPTGGGVLLGGSIAVPAATKPSAEGVDAPSSLGTESNAAGTELILFVTARLVDKP